MAFHCGRVETKCVEQLSLHDIATLDTQHNGIQHHNTQYKGLNERESAAHRALDGSTYPS